MKNNLTIKITATKHYSHKPGYLLVPFKYSFSKGSKFKNPH